jgi:two-component system NtrC family sensor kinase
MKASPPLLGRLRELLIPLLLLVLYVVCFGLYTLRHETRVTIEHIEQDTVRKVSLEMAQLQTTLDYLLREGHATVVREMVASMGANPYRQVGLLLDAQGKVLASTRLVLLGQPARTAWPELALPENTARQRRALEQMQGVVEVSSDRRRVVGYYPVLLSFGPAERRVGLLFFQHDLEPLKVAGLYEVERSVLRSTLMLLLISAGMGLGVYVLLGRRIQRLVVTAQGLVGQEQRLPGVPPSEDALGQLGEAFSKIAEQIGRNRQQIEENEERFQTIIERSPDATLIHWEGQVVFNNPAAAALLGYEKAVDLQGRRIEELVVPEDAPALTEEQEDGVLREVRWMHRSGRQVLGEVVTFPLVFEQQRVRVSIVRDITERKLLQEKLNTADRMASLGTLAAGMAHEINNPLSFMLSNVRFASEELRALAEQWDKDEPQRERIAEVLEALDETLSGGDRVRDIVRDLKMFSRGDEGKRGDVNLHRVLDLCGTLTDNQLRNRARLVKEYGEVPPLHASEARLAQLFLNLITNAAQAIPEGSDPKQHEVRLTTRRDEEGWVVVEVKDTGVGISQEHLHRLFDPFFTTKPVGVGTGLGLSICHGIVAALGGRIGVESQVGHGSTFRVFLPVNGVAHSHGEPSQEPSSRAESSSLG